MLSKTVDNNIESSMTQITILNQSLLPMIAVSFSLRQTDNIHYCTAFYYQEGTVWSNSSA